MIILELPCLACGDAAYLRILLMTKSLDLDVWLLGSIVRQVPKGGRIYTQKSTIV